MNNVISKQDFFDSSFPLNEQLPRIYDVHFKEVSDGSNIRVNISIENQQVGDLLTDNSYFNDGYRYHDVFHFSYAAILGWSPCLRKMMGRKRKSNPKIDEVEDGARATITEEAISLLIYNHGKENNYFQNTNKVAPEFLGTIKKIASDYEVNKCSISDWEKAILNGFSVFRKLKTNKGGTIRVDMLNRKLTFLGH